MPGSTFFLRRCLTRFSSQITSLSSPLLFFLFIEFDSRGEKNRLLQCLKQASAQEICFTLALPGLRHMYRLHMSNCANVIVINAKQKPLQPLS